MISVLVLISIDWLVQAEIEERLAQLPQGTHIVRGGASYEAGIKMLDKRPDLVIVFWDGTSEVINNLIVGARNRGIPVETTREVYDRH